MNGQKLQVFMHKVVNEELFRRRMEQAVSLDSALGVLKSEGLDMGAEEFRAAMRLLLFLAKAPAGDLDESELDTVAGGMSPAAFAVMRDMFAGNSGAALIDLAARWQGPLGSGK